MVYAYEAGTPNRFSEREPFIRLAAWVAQQNVNDSARREGAQRWMRFVTTPTGCQLVITTIQVPAGSSNAYFIDWRNTLKAAGLNASNRIYGVFAEGLTNACAYADSNDIPEDTTPSTANLHNTNPSWLSFAPGCFAGQSLVHEFSHALGAMSSSMPHFGPGSHCTDGIETLCGADAPTVACPDPLAARLMDCGRDDYFAITPQGSYLPSHWNTAYHSLYLEASTATTPQAVPPALPPQLLRAVDGARPVSRVRLRGQPAPGRSRWPKPARSRRWVSPCRSVPSAAAVASRFQSWAASRESRCPRRVWAAESRKVLR